MLKLELTFLLVVACEAFPLRLFRRFFLLLELLLIGFFLILGQAVIIFFKLHVHRAPFVGILFKIIVPKCGELRIIFIRVGNSHIVAVFRVRAELLVQLGVHGFFFLKLCKSCFSFLLSFFAFAFLLDGYGAALIIIVIIIFGNAVEFIVSFLLIGKIIFGSAHIFPLFENVAPEFGHFPAHVL